VSAVTVKGHDGKPLAPQGLQAIWDRLAANQHTGPVIIHLAQGQPNVVEIPGESTRIPVDKGRKRGQS